MNTLILVAMRWLSLVALTGFTAAMAADEAVIPVFADEDQIAEPFQYGIPGKFQSMLPSVSDDGRYIAFQSTSNNLVVGDDNTITDIFVHDAKTGETRMVSVSSSGEIGNDYSTNPSISADGRYVAFESLSSNFFENDTANTLDIFVHDLKSGETELITRAMNGERQNRRAIEPQISADGRFVVFESNSSNIAEPAATGGIWHVYVRDREQGKTEAVSVSTKGELGNHNSQNASISGDGRYIAFNSVARNFEGNAAKVEWDYLDVFVRDRKEGTTVSASKIPEKDAPYFNSRNVNPAISRDGRFIAFQSVASDPEQNTFKYRNTGRGTKWKIYVRDMQAPEARMISVSPQGEPANAFARNPTISADGRYVAFESAARNLVENDQNDNWDVFIWDRETDQLSLASLFGEKNLQRAQASADPGLSADGRYLAFASNSDVRAPGTQRNREDVYLRDMKTGKSRIVSLSTRDDSVANAAH